MDVTPNVVLGAPGPNGVCILAGTHMCFAQDTYRICVLPKAQMRLDPDTCVSARTHIIYIDATRKAIQAKNRTTFITLLGRFGAFSGSFSR